MAQTKRADAELIQIYNEVDAFLRQQYTQDKYADHCFLIQELTRTNRVIARYQQEMRAIAQLRNSIVHNPFIAAQPIATPHPAVIEIYRSIRDALINPPTALGIAVPAHSIYTAKLGSNLHEVLEAMDKRTYTHVPIIEQDAMIGILSENTLLSYLAEAGDAIITRDMNVEDLIEYLPLEAHRSESFVFLPRKTPLSKVYDVFNKAIAKRTRIGMVFLTEHGKPEEKLLGVITAWDLAIPEFGQL